MSRKRILLLLMGLLLLLQVVACSSATPTAVPKPAVGEASIKLNPHPTSLEGKTVVLRWNGKPNGDKYLTNLGRLLSQKAPGAKIINLWETDKSTAVISNKDEASAEIAAKIAALKPDLVIQSQAD